MTASIPIFSPMVRVLDANGDPVANGTVEFYDAGTSTPKTVYADAALGTSLGTTVSTDAGGYPITSGNARTLVYTGTDAFKMIVKDEDDATLVTHDNVPGAVVVPEADTSALSQTPVVSKTTTYSVVAGDQGKLLNCNCTSGSFAVTLLSAVTADDGFEVTVRHVGTANEVTIRAAGSETISRSGGTSNAVALKGYGQSVTLVSDGTNWHVKASADPLVLDGLPNFSVADRLTAPPTSPTPGARYIINGTPTGAWSTLGFAENQVVEADGNGSWFKYTPAEGWSAWVADEALRTVYTSSAWVDWTNVTAPTTSTLECAVIEHQENNGTVGGTATTGAWTKRTLNTSVKNTITGCSLATSQITLPVGTYLINFWQSLHATSGSQSRIKVVSGTATPDPMLHGYYVPYASDSGGDNPLTIVAPPQSSGVLTVTATAVIELQYWVNSSAGGTSALGAVSAEPTGSNEVYARVTILDLAAVQGPAGSQGAQGSDGLDAAYPYQWSTSTSGDPGTGKIAVNNADPTLATVLRVNQTDSAGGVLTAVIATWDDGTSSVRARVKISKEGSTQNFYAYSITGAGTDQGDYWDFPVAFVGPPSGTTLSNADNCAVLVIEKGDKGDTGATGATGSTGATGATGATGPNTGLDYAFNTATSGDPGAGKLLFDNATPASVTSINISKTGRNAESLGTLIGAQDDSTNTAHRGHIRIFTVSDRTKFIEVEYTSTFTDNTTYWTIPVSSVSASGSLPANNDVIAVMFERTGNKGSDGAGTGDITGAANIGDNRLVRGDGGAKGIQESGITVDDSDNVSGLRSLAQPTVPFSGFSPASNLGLAASVSGNALTISIKGADGNDASATNPISVPFRSATATTGTPVWRSLTAALSLTISSGSSLGTANSVPFRVWVVLFDDAGTLRLGAIQRVTGGGTPTAMAAVSDDLIASSTAEGGAGAADSAGVFYTGTAVTSKPFRIVGYVDYSSGLATAGTWASAPTKIQVFGPGVPRPGEVVQRKNTISNSVTTVTTSTFAATASSVAIALTSAVNLVRAIGNGALSAAEADDLGQARIYRDSTGIGPLGAIYIGGSTAESVTTVALDAVDVPGTTSSTTYAIHIANLLGSSNVSWPPNSGYFASITVEEIMA